MVSAPSTPRWAFLQGKAASSAPSLMPLLAHVHILSVQVLNFHPADDPGPWHPLANGRAHCRHGLPCVRTLLPRAPAAACSEEAFQSSHPFISTGKLACDANKASA